MLTDVEEGIVRSCSLLLGQLLRHAENPQFEVDMGLATILSTFQYGREALEILARVGFLPGPIRTPSE